MATDSVTVGGVATDSVSVGGMATDSVTVSDVIWLYYFLKEFKHHKFI